MLTQLNRIELRGILGNVTRVKCEGKTLYRLSVATSLLLRDKEHRPVIETTWHLVNYMSEDENLFKTGDYLHVIGHMTSKRIESDDRPPYNIYEIWATKVEKINVEELNSQEYGKENFN